MCRFLRSSTDNVLFWKYNSLISLGEYVSHLMMTSLDVHLERVSTRLVAKKTNRTADLLLDIMVRLHSVKSIS